ncbi:hypothetical protein NUU61_007228 [Penicillium alfredii]|uniref:F-box domain-containing protein n=1 Tax=Penicillium alfredii TaxID=1506179 RepID=A0A9W9F2B6_9EURO|nr:uncharacterized protein NUU61_007228 [Penicillium alfredii]KAJ5092358.1 hypothetical protein NUU61_007228 [Penicillium alfredii]
MTQNLGQCPLTALPNETLLGIADLLAPRDVGSLLRTARRLATLLDAPLYRRARSYVCVDGNVVLGWAAKRGQAPVIRKLLHPDAAPIPQDHRNKALCLAAEAGRDGLIGLLVSGGADLSAAVDLENLPVVNQDDSLAKDDPEHSTEGQEASPGPDNLEHPSVKAEADDKDPPAQVGLEDADDLENSPVSDHVGDFSDGYEEPPAIDPRWESTCTPLQAAAENGHAKVVQLLLDLGADIAATNSKQETALHVAARKGQEKTSKLLLERGADVTAVALGIETPLHCAVSSQNEVMVRLLLDHGADPEARSEHGQTVMYYALDPGYEPILRLLLKRGAKVTVSDTTYGFTPLHFAVNGSELAVRLLLEHGADVLARCHSRFTPLFIAAQDAEEPIIRLLLENAVLGSAGVQEGQIPEYITEIKGFEEAERLLQEITGV